MFGRNGEADEAVVIGMATATFNGTVIAASDETIVVEGNHYFPRSAVKMEHFAPIDRTTVCGWKGTANYYDVSVDGETATGAAWTYNEAMDEAKNIEGYLAFYPAVTVVE